MKYWLHPEAAEEHARQVAYYEEAQPGLGRRYHEDFRNTMARVCAHPDQFRVAVAPDIHRAMLQVFRFDILYRVVGDTVQVLAVAHHRRQPGYWLTRS